MKKMDNRRIIVAIHTHTHNLKKILKRRYFKITGSFRRKYIKNKNFTIISNNCWGGNIYQSFNIPYQSPTIGLFFIASEYIKFIYNIKDYIYSNNIYEIKIEDSKYSTYLKNIDYKGIIGKINDIEICFLHYTSIDEVIEKWKRRGKRINWNRIIYKFNDQNLCTYQDLKKFQEWQGKNKVCFTSKAYANIDSIVLSQYKNNDYVISDTREKDYRKEFNIIKYLNNI